MVTFICIIIWMAAELCIAIMCGFSLEKEKDQHVSWKRYCICILLSCLLTYFLLYMHNEHYELLSDFFLAVGLICVIIYAISMAFAKR